jgi:hypothetical protein
MRGMTFVISTMFIVTMVELSGAQPVEPEPGPTEQVPPAPEAEVAPPAPPAPAIDPRVLQLEADLRVELDRGRCELALDMLRRLHTFDPHYQVVSDKLTDCVARVAAARMVITRPEPVYHTTVHSYRRQVIIADLASFGLIFAGGVGLAGYFFAAPVIHLAHGNSKGALRSFGLRLVPVGVFLVTALSLTAGSGCRANGAGGCYGEAAGAFLAGLVSMVVVIPIDWAHAKREDRKQVGVRWVPSVNVTRETTGLGLVGSW